ncbi:4-hydroxythreonine-4-phosphate dehydrogenase PdxA [candidate division KSB1 bacterium]|nr:4-hydroxythreonine-4-phosphate dehydrogenase PdxA [candidate division KSB1 bacterium]
MSTKPCIAITVGDPNGIGPEVIRKALSKEEIREICRPLVIGPLSLFKQLAKKGQVSSPEFNEEIKLRPGRVNKSGGMIAGKALEMALKLALTGEARAVVTAPISKEALNLAGYPYPGHTEFFAENTRVEDVLMILMGSGFRVGLVTTHCALSEVAQLLSSERILRKLRIANQDLRARFKIKSPKIAVAALNPHAGENGMFGHEEREIITPAIAAARKLGLDVSGPFPADTLFARVDKQKFDLYLAMYHDQGLIPLKMKAFGKGVNYTAGLPFIRTSPDHGTAFDIAGRGIADSSSMEEAIKLAVELAKNSQEG